MQVNSIQTVFQNEENRTKAKYIGAGTLLSAGSAFLATKASKNAQDTFKMSNRIAKTAAAGVIAAGVMTLLTLKKDDFVAIKDKAMGLINKNKPQEETNNQIEAQNQMAKSGMEAVAPQTEQEAMVPDNSALLAQTPQGEENKEEAMEGVQEQEAMVQSNVSILPEAAVQAVNTAPVQENAGTMQAVNPFEQMKNTTQG